MDLSQLSKNLKAVINKEPTALLAVIKECLDEHHVGIHRFGGRGTLFFR
jgi:hypothetical protein